MSFHTPTPSPYLTNFFRQGRYLGGRPPYGYMLIDVGPHPNPAKAADGKRLHALAIDDRGRGRRAADLRRVPHRVRHLRHCRTADRRRHRVPVRARPATATSTAAASPGPSARSAPSSPTLATPAARSGTASARTKSCSTSTTSRSGPHDQDAVERPGSVDLLRRDRPPAGHRRRHLQAAPRSCCGPERPQDRPHKPASTPARLRAARAAVLRDLRPAHAGQLGQRPPYYRCRFPSRVRPRQPRQPPAQRVPARRRADRARARQLARPAFDPAICPPRSMLSPLPRTDTELSPEVGRAA